MTTNQPTETAHTPRAVIILGMHRSGTSALSGTLGHLGGLMPRDLLPPTDENAVGFWESRPIVTANDELLGELNAENELSTTDALYSPDALRPLDLFYHLPMLDNDALETTGTAPLSDLKSSWSHIDVDRWIDRLCGCVHQEFELDGRFPTDQPMIIKDPRMCRLMPIWMIVLEKLGIEPAFVIALRHPSEVARSLSARSTIDSTRSHWLWMDHMLRAQHATRGHNRVFMEYSDLLDDWQSVIERIDRELGLDLRIQSGAQAVDSFLSTKHRHHSTNDTTPDDLPDLVSRAYTEFKLACKPPYQINTQVFGHVASEFAQTQELSGAWIADAEHRSRQANADHCLTREQHQSQINEAQAAYRQSEEMRQQETHTLKADFESRIDSLSDQLDQSNDELHQTQDQHAELDHQLHAINEEHRSTLEHLDDAHRKNAITKDQLAGALQLNADQIREVQRRAVPTRRLPIKLAANLLAFPIRRRKQMIENIRLVSESSLFDAQWYRSQHPDVDRAGVDPAAHYVGQGLAEGREPSPRFNAKWYLDTHRDVARAGINPLVHYLRTGWLEQRAIQGEPYASSQTDKPKQDSVEQHESQPATQVSIEITSHSPSDFPLVKVDPVQQAKTTAVAFYLPQFHPIPENNAWWGEGFTEWKNVTRAKPQFAGHQQPMRPGELGYYDLRLPEIRQRQAQLAQAHGIGAFCYHYYWFNGRRVLERPLNDVLESKDTTLPFCICWANENWTRRWDGLEQEVLLHQRHTLESDRRFFLDLIPTLEDERYLRVDGKPVIVIYRADLMENAQDSAAVWRDEARRAGLGDIHLCAVQFRTDDPRSLGFDAAIEFPPHHFPAPEITHRVKDIDPAFQGRVLDWASGAARLISKPLQPGYRLYRGVNPGWDNTARRMDAATIYTGATPERYEAWLRSAINQPQPDDGTHENLVFINAWNEWAEGAVLEPAEHCDKAMLKATARAMGVLPSSTVEPKPAIANAEAKPIATTGTLSNPQLADRLKRFVRTTPALNNFLDRRPALKNKAASIVQRVSDRAPAPQPAPISKPDSPELLAGSFWKPAPKELRNADAKTILIQSHDACLAGAQIVVLELLRHLAKDPSIRVYHLLCGSGVLEPEFRKLATTLCIDDLIARGLSREQAIQAAIDSVPDLDAALCNTAAVPEAVRACKQRGIRTIAYLHELPTTIDSMLGGEQTMRTIDQYADEIIVVSEFVRDRLCTRYQLPTDRLQVVYMGLFPSKASPPTRADARELVCNELDINPETPIVLGCGAIHPRKGTDLWVRSAAATIEQLTKANRPIPTFVWVGWDQAGPDFRSWCEHDVQASGISEHIKFIGVRDDTEHYFAAADVFALSSREDPFPLVNLESLVCRTPVVAFENAGGAPEALISTKGDSGIVVGYADAQAMGHAIAQLLSTPTTWEALSHNAHRVMSHELGWDRYINSLLGALLPSRATNTNLIEA